MFMKHYAPNRCEPSIEALNFGGGGGGGGRDQSRCEQRSEVFVKIQKKKFFHIVRYLSFRDSSFFHANNSKYDILS